jgi:hypothetical protein
VVNVLECCDNVFSGFQSSAELDITSALDDFHVGAQMVFAAALATIRNLPVGNVAVSNVLAIPGTNTLRVQVQLTDYNADSKLAIVPQLARGVELNNFTVGNYTGVVVRACCTGINNGYTIQAEVDIVATADNFTFSARNAFGAALAQLRNLPTDNVVVNDFYAVLGTPLLRVQVTVTDFYADSQYVIVPRLSSAVVKNGNIVGAYFAANVRSCCTTPTVNTANVEVDIDSTLDAFTPSAQTTFAAAVATLHNVPSTNVAVLKVFPVQGSSYIRARLNIVDYWVDNSNAILTKFQSMVEHNGYKIGAYAVKAVLDCCSNVDTTSCAALNPQ